MAPTVSLEEIVKVQCSGTVEWIDEIEFDGRFGCNASIVLCPVKRNAALDVGHRRYSLGWQRVLGPEHEKRL